LFKIDTGNGTTTETTHDFILAFHSNHVPILSWFISKIQLHIGQKLQKPVVGG